MRINRRTSAAVLFTVLLASCSSARESAEPTELAPSAVPVTAPTAPAVPGPAATPGPAAAPVPTAVEPVVRVPENPGTLDETNWITRNFMDAESVDLVWAEVKNADVYRVYRIPTLDADYDAIQAGDLDGTSLVYEGGDIGFVDRAVESDLFLTYVLVAQVGNDLTSPRWTEALTIDDTTPPTPITGLTARNTPIGVMLEWDPATDDVEFASYSVSLLEGDRLRYIGGGADESLTSFLDTDTSAGTRTYVVTAVDFHDNRSEPAQIEVTR